MPRRIDSFSGDYAFLSNFYPAATQYDGGIYKTSEHAFQAAKTTSPADRTWIASSETPGIAKRRGRSVRLRPGWDALRVNIMYGILYSKFTLNPHLGERLLMTDKAELIEGNTWGDKFWGCQVGGQGENWLGRLLMDLRSALREGAV